MTTVILAVDWWLMMRWQIWAFVVMVAVGLLPQASAEDWPQFRGLNGSGVSHSKRSLPEKFSTTENKVWQTAIGEGIASPVLASGRLFTTAMHDERTLRVLAFDAASGKQLWYRDLPIGELPPITPPNSQASSTPCADGERVYLSVTTRGLMALDAASGEVAWEHPLPQPQYLMDWGAAASPVLVDDMVVFCQDDDLNPFVLSLDKKTGALRWKTERPEMLAGYSLPVICEANGQRDLVLAGTGKLKGYDPATGKERWSCNSLLRTMMTSPVVRDGVIYLSTQSYGDTERVLKFALLEWKDTNQDGRLTKQEIPPAFSAKFDYGDRNRDGILEGEEIDRAFQSPDNRVGGGSIVQAIRGGGQGDVTQTHMVWNLSNRSPSNMSSPLVVNDLVFLVKKGGLSSAFDRDTGKALWELKRIQNLGEYYASPVTGDGKVYLTGENGIVTVLQAKRELTILAKNDVGGACIGSPAIADGRIYFRTRDTLLCVGLPE